MESVVYQCKGNPSNLVYGPVSAGKCDRADGAGPPERCGVSDEEFAAPDGAVRSQSGAVPDDPEAGAGQVVVRHTGNHVRPVVLNLHERDPFGGCSLSGFSGGQIVRMEVAYKEGRLQAEQFFISAKRSGVVRKCLGVFQIADVGT